MALILKTYQQQAKDALADYFNLAQGLGAASAFTKLTGLPYHTKLDDVPNVCLRVPTGGGKTLIAAHSISVAANNYANTNAPVVLWIVPSDMIRNQTLNTLSDVRHPYRQAIAATYGDRVKVCDLDSLQTINRHDVGKSCIVVVTTIQAFRISKTEKRNVYAFYEELSPHFAGLTPKQEADLEKVTAETLAEQPYLTQADIGRVKHSLANWLSMCNPILIVDEAHNTKGKLSFETYKRLNPACLIELTATPQESNVLYSVSAAELKTAEMIKLPVVLTEHPDGWQACLRDALLQRQQLELDAQKDSDYIRPILLVQAQDKNGEATVEVVREHLIANNIHAETIAVATGEIKELKDINLFSPSCAIRIVITVDALKEGWDCAFAYVLASLQDMRSAKDVEQLLGRVLRMPYAKTRPIASLNKAYAHVVAESVAFAASTLKDKMVENMGFNKWEADLAIQPDLGLSGGEATPTQKITPEVSLNLQHMPDSQFFAKEVSDAIRILPTTQGAMVIISKGTDSDTFAQIESAIVKSAPAKHAEKTQEAFNDARATRQALSAPETWNATFAPIAQLCLELDGHWQVVEQETIENAYEWSLLDFEVQLEQFSLRETANAFEIDVNVKGEQLTYRHTDTKQLDFDAMQTTITEHDLVEWLDKKTRRAGLTQTQLRAYLLKLVTHLIHTKNISLTALQRAQFQLAQAVKLELDRLFALARKQAFQGDLFEKMTIAPVANEFNQFRFEAGRYPVKNAYRGGYEFKKHYYAAIDDLREKTLIGNKIAEEFACAQAIDMHPKVKYWVRNIAKQRETSFWLPTATDYFYPDFIVELNDGAIALIEYKGEIYKTNDDSREKNLVGNQWAKDSNCKRLYLMAVSKDDSGRNVKQQIDEFLNVKSG
jgi:type III restriction enzyme